ncbi:MAG: hypothetical protein ABIV04_03015 [Massilia sp.]
MVKVKNSHEDGDSRYEVAAAARRAKIGASAQLIPGEVTPANGRIRVTLSAANIRSDNQTLVFGPSSIQIPEFSAARRSKQSPNKSLVQL